jgi:hypothetical protein
MSVRSTGQGFAVVLSLLTISCHAPATGPLPSPPMTTDGRRPGAVMVVVRAGGQPVEGATVRVFGDALPDQPVQQTGADGALALTGLDGDDTLVVQAAAPGYLPASHTSAAVSLADGRGLLQLDLLPATGVISGRVVGDAGPVAGACVSDGRVSTLTDAAGEFRLAVGEAQSTLKVAATGYATRTLGPVNVAAASATGDLRLEGLGRPLTVLVANASKPFGDRDGDLAPLAPLYRLLGSAGFQTLRQTGEALPDLSKIDIVLLPVPSAALPTDQRQALTEWVRQGGKLVVLGEWGGYGAFSVQAANDVLQPCNLAFGADTLRQVGATDAGAGLLTITPGPEPRLWDGIRQIRLRQAASVQVVEGNVVPLDAQNTHPIGRIGKDGLRIAAVWGQFSPIALALVGAGRVIAVGDASLWAADGEGAGGTMDHLSDDNRSFALNVFRW